MTFRSRIIFGFSVLLLVTMTVMLFTLRFLLAQYTMKQLDVHHAFEASELSQVASEFDARSRDEQLKRHLRIAEDLYKFHLTSADNRLVYRSPSLESVPARLFVGITPGLNTDFAGLGDCWVTEHPLDGYTLRIVTPMRIPLRVVHHFEHIGLAALFATGLVSLFTGMGYARWLVRPLIRLETAADRIDAGEADRIPAALAGTTDEVGRIARRLNAGYERMADSINRLRFFSAEVSHELRTPMSIVRLNAENILEHPDTPPAVRDMAEEQIAEIRRQKRLIENLLGFAKLDAGAVRMNIRPVDAAEWVSDLADDATALAEEAGVRFEWSNTCHGQVSFDAVWIRQVLFNLLGNALRFSPPGGTLILSAACAADDYVLTLTDEGPGVPAEKLSAIFERYSRFGEERGPSEGVGLGLAISRSVVTLHGGSICAENRADRSGLRVTLRLPRAGSTSATKQVG